MADEVFKLVNGCCPYCNSRVNIIEGMVFDYLLDKDGYPEELNEEQYRITAYCPNCAVQLFPLPNGDGTYRIYPQFAKPIIERSLILFGRNDHSIKRISVLGESFMSGEDNPFTNTKPKELPEDVVVDGLIEDEVPW